MFDFRHPGSADWQSRQLVITPELLGMRSVGDCRERVQQLGLTQLPSLPYRQEYWRLDVLLQWSKKNGFAQLPTLGRGPNHHP
jgi:hypothetical protein